MKIFSYKKNAGYTIIETMIAVSVFIVIVMAGMGALLNANLLHNKSKDMRSIMDNLSFIMEDMSRNLRTGYNYRCYTSGTWNQSLDAPNPVLNNPQSCASGGVLVFEEAHGRTPFVPVSNLDPNATDQWVYKIEGSSILDIFKSTDGGVTWVQLNPDEVELTSSSGFSVLGAEASSLPDSQQPLVNIRLVGRITYKNVVTPFSLQTTVSQRLIDR